MEITHVAVSPAARRGGVATLLVEATFDRLRADGIEVVGLGTGGDDFHAPARALYEWLGFHRIPITGYLRRL